MARLRRHSWPNTADGFEVDRDAGGDVSSASAMREREREMAAKDVALAVKVYHPQPSTAELGRQTIRQAKLALASVRLNGGRCGQ